MNRVQNLLFVSLMVLMNLTTLYSQTTNYPIGRRTDLSSSEGLDNPMMPVNIAVETNQNKPGKAPLDLCVPEYSTGCAEGDGFMDFAVAEIDNYESGCENINGTGWSQYLELGPAIFLPGTAYDFIMRIGYNNQHVSIWIDFNNDSELTPGEVILSDYELESAGVLYTVPVTIPADALPGQHLMRARTNWSAACTDPCANYNYGEAEDYTVIVGEPAFGSLEGTVTLVANGLPVADAQILLSGLFNYMVNTGADGNYELENVMAGDYSIVCSKEGYNPVTTNIVIIEDEALIQNFQLTQPTIDVNPLSISVTLDPNTTAEEIITIENNGNGSLDWSASLQIMGKGTEDFMDLQFEYPVGVGGGEAGIETDGSYFYTSKWNGASFYKYALDGTYLGTFMISGVAAVRDMAYDGSMFFGGSGFSTVYEMDFENQVLVSSFVVPTNVRAIAYNPDLDIFYANNWSTPVVAFDKAGNNLGSFNVGPDGGEYYGFAYDNGTLGGPYLWGYAQLGDSKNVIYQLQLPSGTETGFSLDMATKLSGQLYNSAGGLFAYPNLVMGKWTLGGLVQSERIWGLELADAQTWISISPNTGTLNGGTSQEINVLFDAAEMLPGTYQAEIHLTSNPNVGVPVVQVEMIVNPATHSNEVLDFASDLNIYPNPVNDRLTVTCNNDILLIELYSLTGDLIMSKQINDSYIEIFTNQLSKGTYFLKLYSQQGTFTRKILIR